MKVLTVLGTRPEIIRLSRVIEKLDRACEHVVVHTGQNYDRRLNELFFEELAVRAPDHHLEATGSLGEQIGTILAGVEKLLLSLRPDRFLVLGDTNSGLAAVVAKRLGIPVYHMEAGNRCYDDRVPEEVNRRIIDHSSDVLMPYTERSRANLVREGIPGERIFVTGNPIFEVLEHHVRRIDGSGALGSLGLQAGEYFLVTMHRAENVDVRERLERLTTALRRLADEFGRPVIVSTHPHTAARLRDAAFGREDDRVRFLEPFGFFDFVHLEKNARCVLTDSGTVQEECCIFGKPAVTLRDVTERPETLECGSNVLAGADPEAILRGVRLALEHRGARRPPPEYVVPDVSGTVVKILLGFLYRPR
jgi:UDP-N-acetylglucosamine 2-epimerase (non-hydrolysing)